MPNYNPPSNFQDLSGQKFGWLTVHGQNGRTERSQVVWKCQCVCGAITDVITARLRNGASKSCGCRMPEMVSHAKMQHGQSRSRLGAPQTGAYSSWASMHHRCKSDVPKTRRVYKDRGITICERWYSFDNFYADMGARPAGKTIDRKDNDLGYFKDNCRWATPLEQRLNQRHMKAKE